MAHNECVLVFFETADFELDARRGEGRAAELTLVVNEQLGRACNAAASQRMRFWKGRRQHRLHCLKFRKQAPPLKEYVDALHTAKILDIPVHAQATWLAEIATRSRAAGESPTKLQVRDLLDGTHWLITNVF